MQFNVMVMLQMAISHIFSQNPPGHDWLIDPF